MIKTGLTCHGLANCSSGQVVKLHDGTGAAGFRETVSYRKCQELYRAITV